MKIDWKNINSRGKENSSFIPEQMKKLISSDENDRNNGYWNLDSTIVHDGVLYESSAYVTIELLSFLEDINITYRDRVYILLWEIYNGDSFVKIPSPTLKEIFGENVFLSIFCKTIILSKIEIFQEEIITNKFNCRKEALELFTSFYDSPILVTNFLKSEAHNSELVSEYLEAYRKSIDGIQT